MTKEFRDISNVSMPTRFERYIDLADIVPLVNELTPQQSYIIQ